MAPTSQLRSLLTLSSSFSAVLLHFFSRSVLKLQFNDGCFSPTIASSRAGSEHRITSFQNEHRIHFLCSVRLEAMLTGVASGTAL